ncbi:Methyltransferase domain-containing protein [Nannocystis exedens]|uniref:site-specific DNA-methyltransferase (adenine-specific) n=1 Tax=Nannocystis exedens TaxID=54 RepID=A0A1I2HPS6_9BACT|nr:N-6 DNA methylase [Nannocystis exedens]PCC69377.1 Type IIS restriction enzyme Eco57I [Nannocystis exedens]SFF31433.1 Methyltransferase domain-containing protein [Nannocystis exedens]
MNEAARAHERGLDPVRRKRDGVFYTPAPLVARLVDDALGRALAAAPAAATVRVVDPACGAGAFLVAAGRALLARGEQMARETGREWGPADRLALLRASIFGVDVDPAAIELARAAVAELAGAVPEDMSENIKVGNALLGADAPVEAGRPFVWAEEFPAAAEGFDAVLGNPPFVDAEAMTRHHAALRRYCAGSYAAARGNWDLFCVFVELALRLCAPGGHLALVVPNKLASADYAAAARRLLTREARVLALYDLSGAPPFAAGVYPLAFVARRGAGEGQPVTLTRGAGECVEMSLGTGLSAGPWPISGRGDAACVAHMRAVGKPLGGLAQVWGAATVAEAYAIAELIVEGEAGLRVVNSGTIDRCAELWGKTPLRYLGRSFLRPVIAAPERLPPRRLAQARTPKLIVAGMTRTLEAMIDARGEILAGKSTTICWWPADLRVLAAIVHSRAMDDYYQHVHGGDRLARGYLRIGPRQLRGLPIPPPDAWDAEIVAQIATLVDRWTAGDASVAPALDALVDALYGLA